ncbi:MAG: M6 family metalloprotease domain-containing protein [Dysgonamonadaceae bacterium]|jgi:M6 family metalloprotease-like protein|nr:M6 family metalloprotease domain-containing protein [Dysgonamonadaceae bacterium]
MKNYYISLFISLFLVLASGINAAPAYPGLIKLKQPNGDEISLYMKGDEKVHWMESEDGYSLLYSKEKYIVYAILDEEENMIPSNLIAGEITLRSANTSEQLKTIPKNLRYSPAQINTLKGIWQVIESEKEKAKTSPRAAIGVAHAICALIQFPNLSLVKTNGEFENLLNQTGYAVDGARGSVRDFYFENSYGNLELIVTLVGPYTVSRNFEYYGENDNTNNGNDKRPQELAIEAADSTFKNMANPAIYDNDNDGFIDTFHFIFAGYGEESGGSANTIWSHKWSFMARKYGSKSLKTYSCSPELRNNTGSNITRVGVICHELGHVFGAPDFYDADGDGSGGSYLGTGNWDIMAGGTWNNSGISPAHINMYQKIQLGWVNPIVLNTAQAITNMPNSVQNPVAYRINTSVPGEYYILENRQKVGFDSFIPGTGLLIYHVSITGSDITGNIVNNGHPQKVYTVCASSGTAIPNSSPYSYGDINSAGCPFPGTSGKTVFADYTTPSAFTWNGTHILKPITNISQQNNLISFRFMMPDEVPVPSMTASVSGQKVQLSWTKPNETVTGYNIYRNNQLLIKIIDKNTLTYTQNNVNPGAYSYCITAIYNEKESIPICRDASVTGSEYYPLTVKNLKVNKGQGNNVELSWEKPFINEWKSHVIEPDPVYGLTDNFIAAVKFNENDLQYSYGSRLTKIQFYIYNLSCQYAIKVWLTNKNTLPNALQPIIDQQVIASKRDLAEITLSTPVKIEPGKELWIGVSYKLSPSDNVAVGDVGPAAEGRNYVYANNSWIPLANIQGGDFNWYINGYLDFGDMDANSKYKIYRDATLINTVTGTNYADNNAPAGSHFYCVAINYNDAEYEQTCAQSPTATGIENLLPENQVSTYPNPIAKGETLTIDLGDSPGKADLSFYTASGQLIRSEFASNRLFLTKIDMNPGIYILRIAKNKQISNLKIVVK